MEMPRYSAGEGVEAARHDVTRQWWPGYLLVAVLLAAGTVGGVMLGGPLGQFMLAGVETLPFAVLALLAYLGVARIWARVLAFLWLGVVLLGLAGTAMLLIFGALLARSGALETMQGGGGLPPNILPPGGRIFVGRPPPACIAPSAPDRATSAPNMSSIAVPANPSSTTPSQRKASTRAQMCATPR